MARLIIKKLCVYGVNFAYAPTCIAINNNVCPPPSKMGHYAWDL